MMSLHFPYLAKLYLKNLLSILVGLSLTFVMMDYFQYSQKLPDSSNYKILYIYYMWLEALNILYPLSIVFALILTKISLTKNGAMVALHALGYGKRRLFFPFFIVALLLYLLFVYLNTTEFAYAKDRANFLLKRELNAGNINDLFFKYNDMFVYVNRLDPIKKVLYDITLFKVKDNQVLYTLHAPHATFEGNAWIAKDTMIKVHEYDTIKPHALRRYRVEYKKYVKTLQGYKPKIIESFYEGKSLTILDAYRTWKLLQRQHLNSDKIRALIYEKIAFPLFALAMTLILFFKLPFHARMMNLGRVVGLALGATFIVWGILFGLRQMGANGALSPELSTLFPIVILWCYAIYVYITDEKRIR